MSDLKDTKAEIEDIQAELANLKLKFKETIQEKGRINEALDETQELLAKRYRRSLSLIDEKQSTEDLVRTKEVCSCTRYLTRSYYIFDNLTLHYDLAHYFLQTALEN